LLTAITGGIAEGKSTVLGFVSDLGYKTLSADSVAREVFSDPDVNVLLAQLVGTNPPIAPQTLRHALAESPEIRHSVNRITHPRIMDAIRSSDAEFIEIPLLIESCLQGQFDCVWVVTCGLEEQRRRLEARYGPSGEGELLLNVQLPTLAKIPFADEVFRTNCAFEAVRRNVSKALARRFETG